MSINATPDRLHGLTGDKTRAVLNALFWQPQRVADVMEATGLPREKAWPLIKHLMERGLVERHGRGLYQTSAQGRGVLNPYQRRPEAPVKPERTRRPPLGWKWTPDRVKWLERFYPLLGPHRCALLLGRDYTVVHAKATKMGLRWGEVDGYVLLSDLARLLDRDYANLYARAQRAQVLTFPATALNGKVRRKALVPDWWVEQIAAEMQPPMPGEIPLAALREELGLSKTHAQRLTQASTVLRVPPEGGQAQLYVPADAATRLRAQWRSRTKPTRALGRPAVYAALTRAGAQGLTEKEAQATLNAGQGMIRVHIRTLFLEGQLERCRMGDSRDPFVYRLKVHQGQPEPARRVPATKPRRAA